MKKSNMSSFFQSEDHVETETESSPEKAPKLSIIKPFSTNGTTSKQFKRSLEDKVHSDSARKNAKFDELKNN